MQDNLLRSQAVVPNVADNAGFRIRMQFPDIPGQAIEVAQVHFYSHEAISGGQGLLMGLTHTLEAPVPGGNDAFHSLDVWIMSSSLATDRVYFNRGDMWIAGPQLFIGLNTAGAVVDVTCGVLYRMVTIGLTAWTDLRSKTSREQG